MYLGQMDLKVVINNKDLNSGVHKYDTLVF